MTIDERPTMGVASVVVLVCKCGRVIMVECEQRERFRIFLVVKYYFIVN